MPPDALPAGAGYGFLPQNGVLPMSRALPLSGLTILLVEDSRFASDALRLMCQRSGARLRRAGTLEQARAHLRTYTPDVVIVDLGLPDGRGDRLIRDLATGRSGMVVLGLSGDPDGRGLALAAGAMGFVEKPFGSLSAFQALVTRHFPGRSVCDHGGPDVLADFADPLALQDDLAHAADLMAMAPDAAGRSYLADFVAGVARSVGDADLAEAAGAARDRAEALPRLKTLVHRRLTDRAAF